MPLSESRRAIYQQRYDSLHDLYDRAVLTLSGGALALSVTFVSNAAASPPVGQERLAVAWICLGVSVLLITSSYIPSIESHRRILLTSDDEDDDDSDTAGTLAYVFSLDAGVLLAVGLSLLAWFSFDNLH